VAGVSGPETPAEANTAEAAHGVSLPSDLLAAVADLGAARIALVQGAGCSIEPPTNLPLSRELSVETHRKLKQDGVSGVDNCGDPSDLSQLADAIYAANGTQRPVIDRFPPNRLANAAPNSGHIVAAALLCERAVGSVMTLNFDLAQRSALSVLGAANVATLRGPEDFGLVGGATLIFLHRNIDADPDALILRTDTLNDEWRDHWQEVVADRVLASAFVVFCGVGTSSSILEETTRRILDAVAEGGRVYVVDPSPPEYSKFFQSLSLPSGTYLRMTWCEFAAQLGSRLVAEHVHIIREGCNALSATNSWEMEDINSHCAALETLNLLELGELRAKWMLNNEAYLQHEPSIVMMLADLVIGVALLARLTDATAKIDKDGVVEFEGNHWRSAVVMCSGGGYRRWAATETAAVEACRRLSRRKPAPAAAVVSGFVGGREAVSAPQDLVSASAAGGLVGGPIHDGYVVVSLDEVRADPSRAMQAIGAV
jgi:hypothetical protein